MLIEVNAVDLLVCNPLWVATNSLGKQRFIVDSSYVNQYLQSCKIKHEDIHTAADLFQHCDGFFNFDYTIGYHHVEIFSEHTKFLGCLWLVNGSSMYFKFTVRPFGLSVGPFIFTKIQKAQTKHRRSRGIRIITDLDDGAVADYNFQEAQRVWDLCGKMCRVVAL